ncbi:MAG: metallophosphoesterase family protein [Microscillaceae bacterium]|nr:metallophosphoesterase family protein [Microscillaceae bacterium]
MEEIEWTPFYFIPKPEKGTRWAIGDIHGCPQTLRFLVEEVIKLSKEDQLFLLGDYIDRGPDSGSVIDLILAWQEAHYQIFPLRGNHEDLLLASSQEYTPRLHKGLLRLQKCHNILDEQDMIRPHYLDFIRKLPYYYELDNFFLVHGGFDFKKEKPFEDVKSMLWLREFEPDLAQTQGKIIIRGHVPQPLPVIEASIDQKSPIITLDNGCVYHYRKAKYLQKYETMGNLLALNLDTWELRKTPNIDLLSKHTPEFTD